MYGNQKQKVFEKRLWWCSLYINDVCFKTKLPRGEVMLKIASMGVSYKTLKIQTKVLLLGYCRSIKGK